MREEWRAIVRGSNVPLGKNAQHRTGPAEERIPFLALVEVVFPGDKPEVELAKRSGCDESTCRRWLRGDYPPPWSAMSIVLGEIIRRVG